MLDSLGGESARGLLLKSVFTNWTKSPIYGVGLGAQIPGLPWYSYEMEFVARLYTTGILGFIILLFLMIYLGVKPLCLIKKYRVSTKHIGPVLVGYLSAVISTLSNPYIFAGFDYLFMLFLPVALMNICILEAEENNTDSNTKGLEQ